MLGSVNTFPHLQDHMTAAKDTNVITEKMLEAVFSAGSLQRLYNETLSSLESVRTRSWLRCVRVASQ
jgi:hypothetical protein